MEAKEDQQVVIIFCQMSNAYSRVLVNKFKMILQISSSIWMDQPMLRIRTRAYYAQR